MRINGDHSKHDIRPITFQRSLNLESGYTSGSVTARIDLSFDLLGTLRPESPALAGV